jgi:subfamily B ATP-binding cassette protein MsbA
MQPCASAEVSRSGSPRKRLQRGGPNCAELAVASRINRPLHSRTDQRRRTEIAIAVQAEITTIIALIAAMLWIDPVLTLVAAVIAPFFAYPIEKIGRKLRRVAAFTQEQTGQMASLITESLAGIRIAKTYRMEGYLKTKAIEIFDEVRRLKMKAANARGKLDPLLEAGGGIAMAAVLVLIGQRILSGASTVGDFTGFVSALIMAAQPIRALGNLNAIVQEAASALQRTFAVMDDAPRIQTKPNAKPLVLKGGEIRFSDLSFSYNGKAKVVDHINLVAEASHTTALVGRSGSGKSSLLSLVPRLYDVTEGAILIDGQDIRDVTLASLRSAIAMVSQDVVLFDDTVRANIAFGRSDTSDKEIMEAAKAAAAHDFIMKLPEGYDTVVGPGGGRLSGGERQRISLARAFLKDAPILLLDEATSALDSESERLVQDAIRKLMQGRTTLVIAHRLSTVRNAEKIVVMEAGRIMETGSHDALIAKAGAYARLHRLQLSKDDEPQLAASS